MNTSPWSSIVAALAAVIAAFLAYRASTQANRTTARKVDLDEYTAQQERYRKIIDDQDRQIERTRNLANQTAEQLARQQEINAGLRNEVRALQGQVDLLSRGRRPPPTSEE